MKICKRISSLCYISQDSKKLAAADQDKKQKVYAELQCHSRIFFETSTNCSHQEQVKALHQQTSMSAENQLNCESAVLISS